MAVPKSDFSKQSKIRFPDLPLGRSVSDQSTPLRFRERPILRFSVFEGNCADGSKDKRRIRGAGGFLSTREGPMKVDLNFVYLGQRAPRATSAWVGGISGCPRRRTLRAHRGPAYGLGAGRQCVLGAPIRNPQHARAPPRPPRRGDLLCPPLVYSRKVAGFACRGL